VLDSKESIVHGTVVETRPDPSDAAGCNKLLCDVCFAIGGEDKNDERIQCVPDDRSSPPFEDELHRGVRSSCFQYVDDVVVDVVVVVVLFFSKYIQFRRKRREKRKEKRKEKERKKKEKKNQENTTVRKSK
jgi:hypothetical protein